MHSLRCMSEKPWSCPQIAFGGVNSRVYHDIAEKHGITSYPWVTSFYKGKKIEDMAGLGGWESVYNWAKAKHKVSAHPTLVVKTRHVSPSLPDRIDCVALPTGQLEAR